MAAIVISESPVGNLRLVDGKTGMKLGPISTTPGAHDTTSDLQREIKGNDTTGPKPSAVITRRLASLQ